MQRALWSTGTKEPFRSREQLGRYPARGPGFEQAAGFLRIRDIENPLDKNAVHPESYNIVDAMAHDIGCSVVELMKDGALRKTSIFRAM